MKFKIKYLIQCLYCTIYLCVLFLNIYALYIDSLMPRICSYILVGLIFLMHFSTKGNKGIYLLKRLMYISISFLLVSLLSIIMFGNTSIFKFEFLWNVLQPSVFMITGAIIAIRVEDKNRDIIYKIIMIGILITIFLDFSGNFITYDYRHYSIYSNALLYGSFILVAFYLVYYLVKNVYLKTILLIVCFYACILTSSRSAWVSLVVTFTVCILFRKNENLTISKLVFRGIFVVVLSIVLFVFGSQIETFINDVFSMVSAKIDNVLNSTSAVFRVDAIEYLWEKSSFLSIVFGNGVGATKDLVTNAGLQISRFQTSDNQYMTLLYDYGLMGVFWIVKLCQLVFRNVFENQKTASNELKMLSIIILSLMITGFFYETIGNANIAAIALTFIGILCQLDYKHKKELNHSESITRHVRKFGKRISE